MAGHTNMARIVVSAVINAHYNAAQAAQIERLKMSNFKRIRSDVNGNPRFVTSWLGYGFENYQQAIKAANKIGGSKYHNKSFGGGLVFQAYECELADIEARLKAAAV